MWNLLFGHVGLRRRGRRKRRGRRRGRRGRGRGGGGRKSYRSFFFPPSPPRYLCRPIEHGEPPKIHQQMRRKFPPPPQLPSFSPLTGEWRRSFFFSSSSSSQCPRLPAPQPPIGCMQNGKLSRNACTLRARFRHVWRRFCMLSRGLSTKFTRRSSVESLLRVPCWLGGRLLREPQLFFLGNLRLPVATVHTNKFLAHF